MVRMAVLALIGGVALMPFVDKEALDKSGSVPVVMHPADEAVFIAANSSGVQCRIVTKSVSQNAMVTVRPDDDCAALHEGFATITGWKADESGQVELKDANGMTFAVLAPSDGLAYEAVSPASLMLTLERQAY